MNKNFQDYISYLENLTPATLSALSNYVTADIRFADPLNDATGVEQMRKIFLKMFAQIEDIRFFVNHAASQDNYCLLHWRFEGRFKGKVFGFDGTSFIRFSQDGLVIEHIDYWDASSNFFEYLPIVGWLITWIKRRLHSDQRLS